MFGVIPVVRGGNLEIEEEEESDADEIEWSDDDSELEDDMDVKDDFPNEAESEEASARDDEQIEESSLSSGPVKLTIKTNLQCAISDQCLEFTASGKRTVASLKQG